MSNGMEVGAATLARRGIEVSEAALGVSGGSLVAAAQAIADALPGSRSAAAATALAGRWDRAVALWSADAAAQGEALSAAADDYAEADGGIATSLERAGPGLAGLVRAGLGWRPGGPARAR